jgi:hypothetical protein
MPARWWKTACGTDGTGFPAEILLASMIRLWARAAGLYSPP